MIRIISNRFQKKCGLLGCNRVVQAEKGVAICINGNWNTYHNDCLPEEFQGRLLPTNQIEPSIFMNEIGEIYFEYNSTLIEQIKTIPGRCWNKDKRCWKIPLTNESLSVALPICDAFKIIVPESIRQQRSISVQAKATPGFEIQNIDKLYDYQIAGAKFLASKNRALLGDQMGTGKTIQSLSAIPINSRVLIIAPACVKYNWVKEANRWRPDYSVKVITGKKNFLLPEINQIVICNREIIPDYFKTDPVARDQYCPLDAEIIAPLREIIVLVDEAHYFKGVKTNCHKKLRNITKYAKQTWALTGTPLTSRPLDLWGVLSSCNMENIVFKHSFLKPFNFFAQCFGAHKGDFGMIWGEPSPIVPELLKSVFLARKREDVLPQLPSKTYTDLEVELGSGKVSSKIRKKLDNLEKQFNEFFTSGRLPPFEHFAEIRAEIACSRREAMLEYIDDCEEQETPLVVFSAHVKPFDVLRGRPGWAIIDGNTPPEDRQKIVEAFQIGLINGVACTIQAGGVGITLTRAWKALFVDQDWVPANNWQAEDRICRIGQTNDKVEIVRFVSNHPLDRRLMELLSNKADLIRKTFG